MAEAAAEITIERPRAELIVEDVSFWFIWTKTGHLPRKAHTTWAEAETEAIRLAHLVPGKKFIVLEARSKLHVEPITGGHASDCAAHNEPAYPAGPCDCGVLAKQEA